VSGASSNHFKSLCAFIKSVNKYELEDTRLIIYDLGLTSNEHTELQRLLCNNFKKFELCIFDYSKYPYYFNIQVNAGEYAWKVAILYEVYKKYRHGLLFWLDAGCLLYGNISPIWKLIDENKIYSPHSSETMGKWVHIKCQKWFHIEHDEKLLNKNPRSGGIVGFNLYDYRTHQILEQYYRCACTKECIAPEGSDRLNHRQDQAILSILYYQFMETYKFREYEKHECISTHNDIG
jgi:hypothetical protein